jgi:CheY-like chemotaxis protein
MEAIGQLAGGVAHDFNNLLTVIQGYSSMSQEGMQADDLLREPLEEIEKAATSAAALTRQLLTFSRRQMVRPQVLNLNIILRQIEKMLRRLIGEDVELITALGDHLPEILADPGLIEQVVMNLAVNARDAMPQGGKLVLETSHLFLDKAYAGAHLAVKMGKHVMLALSDTGIGMSAEVLSHIFEPFYTTKPQGRGTGLGLATVYGIVQQMEGTIWVYSEPQKGTTFKIFFPAAEGASATEGLSAQEPAVSGGREQIMLVEDEEGVRKFIRTMLEKQGYTILEAASPDEALSLASETATPIDLMLTDVIMPRMNGAELAGRISHMRPGVKVLFMSGYSDRTVGLHDHLDEGAEFIQKPFTPHSLAKKLRGLLGEATSEQRQR